VTLSIYGSSDKLSIYHNAVCKTLLSCPTPSHRQPLHWMAFEEGPGRNDDDESESGSGETDVKRQLDILENESDNECNSLIIY